LAWYEKRQVMNRVYPKFDHKNLAGGNLHVGMGKLWQLRGCWNLQEDRIAGKVRQQAFFLNKMKKIKFAFKIP
jgi:hypothetical protein